MEETNKDFDFNIQLFAEGEQPTVDNTPVEQPTQDSNPEPSAPQEAQEEDNDFDWKVDENGDVQFNPAMFEDDEEESPSAPEPQVQEEQPQTPPEPQKFTVKVDGVDKEVTLDELRNGYMMNSDYTRKTQALADKRKQLESQYAQRNPNQGQPQQPQNGQQPQQHAQPNKVDPKEYYKNLSDYAIKHVQDNLGEDFDEYNPVHQAALADEISTIKAKMYERNVSQQEMQTVASKYAQDPNFNEIDKYAAQVLQQMPYQQAVKIQQALQRNDARVVDSYLEAVRDRYYRQRGYVPAGEQQVPQNRPVATPPKQVPKQAPPFAESTGAIKNTTATPRTLDYSKLGRMTLEQQAKLASKLGLG